jgi:hypothetical protein
MQKFGFDLVQNGNRDGKSHLIYKEGMVKILLGEESGILTLKTKELILLPEERRDLDDYVDRLLEKDKGETDHCLRMTRSSLPSHERSSPFEVGATTIDALEDGASSELGSWKSKGEAERRLRCVR